MSDVLDKSESLTVTGKSNKYDTSLDRHNFFRETEKTAEITGEQMFHHNRI